LIYVVEILKSKRWTYFFEVFGKNPLVLYALSGMIVKTMSLIRVHGLDLKTWLYNSFFLSVLEPKNASLCYALFYMLVIWLIGYLMDRRKIYIKV
jgi:predicted acyltransferase